VHYESHVIRPPSEAESILLEVTVGCSHNRCAFCAAYALDRFRIKDDATILADLSWAAEHMTDAHRVFLVNGDALIAPQHRLVAWLRAIREKLPWVTRVGTYANAKAIARKSAGELRELFDLGLKVVHMGLESGDDTTLRAMNKWGNAAEIVEQGRRVREAGPKLFVTVLLGLGGTHRSREHAEATGRALSAMQPDYVGALTLMLVPHTPLHAKSLRGEFTLGSPIEVLRELRTMLEHTDMPRGIFYANHASSYLSLRARMPRDKEDTLRLLDRAIKGEVPLRPEWMRAL
jgi:radical SAM superfamily enzyme YgiQ (UPF0313 family)